MTQGSTEKRTRCAARAAWLFGALAAVPAVAPGLSPEPRWHEPAYTRRLVAEPGPLRGAPLLIVAPPGTPIEPERGLVAIDPGGRSRPVEFVGSLDGAPALRVGPTGRTDGRWAVYFAPDPDTEPPRPADLPASPPFRVDHRRLQVATLPNTWDRFWFMLHQADPVGSPGLAMPGNPLGFERRRGPRGRQSFAFAARLQGYVEIDASGLHRFALEAESPAWLLVNGEPAAEAGLRVAPRGIGDPGPPVFLAKGVHRLEIYAAIAGRDAVSLHWIPPGSASPEPFPVERNVAPDRSAHVRLERRDRTLHPDFTFEVLRAYAFRRLPGRFYETQFRDASATWLTPGLRLAWRFDGAPSDGPAEGAEVTHVFRRPGPHRVALHARDALGFAAAIERVVEVPDQPPEVHALSARLADVPAVAYPDDPVAPLLRLVGRVPRRLRFRIEWEQDRADGRTVHGSAEVMPGETGAEIPLPAGVAGETRALRWRVLHAGAVLIEEEVRFLAPPFETAPARVDGDALFDRHGTRLVLLPHRSRAGYRQPPITPVEAFGRILVVDDTLFGPAHASRAVAPRLDGELARIVDGPDLPIVRVATPSPWTRHPEALGPLVLLAEAERILAEDPPDVVVLSVGLRERAAGLDPGAFERRAAALSDLLSATWGHRVLWITPPPHGASPEARAYAQAVRRVADARAMPVADLFTAFMGEPPGGPALVRDGQPALTDEGHRRAAIVVARALLAQARETP